ncbi:hypothetical protein XENORESO_015644 [Xenotaenia resolanae]|uniref:PARP16 N-terminal domain-containing protein n=1 Tax=Xenotaenia resolanae TaxID=208358 RepID=A0ABV0VVT4_9TELE
MMGPGVRSGHVTCGLFFTHVPSSLSWVVPALLDHGPGNGAGFAAGRHDQSESRMECLSSTPFRCHSRLLNPVLGMQPPLPPEAVRELVSSCLHRDPVAADLRCSLFVAAAQSYKRDSLLRPFPPRYTSGDIKDFEGLVRALVTMKSLSSMLEIIYGA